ncbi:hypothetical protein ACHAXR_011077 [Thalassiosira sp. AJA248-18]
MAPIVLLQVATIIVSGIFNRDYHLTASALIVAPRHSSGRQRLGIDRFFGRSTQILCAAPNDDTDKDTGDSPSDDVDLDQQILALENMLKSGADENDKASTNMNTSLLTSTRKQRLEREIELIKRLDPEHPENNSDYSDLQNQELVVSELWALWYGERGSMNERKLHAIEELLVDPDLWPEAEKQYLELIREHCSTHGSMDNINLSNWVEPANRLATLLFLMGKFGESKQWCERILRTKPWHIGALSGVVMVCMKMGDKEGAMKYSQMGLPNLSAQMRNLRKEWVEQNVQFAEKNLLQLEELNRKAYGEPDESSLNYSKDDSINKRPMPETEQIENETENDNSAWQ